MAIQLRKTLVGAFMAFVCFNGYMVQCVLAQSDDSAPPAATASETKAGFGGALSKMFGGRPAATPSPAKPKQAKPEPASEKTPGFQGGLFRPFKAIRGLVGEETHPSVSEEDNPEQKFTPETKSKARAASKPYREPFTAPEARTAVKTIDEETIRTNSKTNFREPSQREATTTTDSTNGTAKRSASAGDVLQDPPSIVGTGIPNRIGSASRPSNGSIGSDVPSSGVASPGANASSRAKQLPQIVSPDNYRDRIPTDDQRTTAGNNASNRRTGESASTRNRDETIPTGQASGTRSNQASRYKAGTDDDLQLSPIQKKPLPSSANRTDRVENSGTTVPGYALPNSRYGTTTDSGFGSGQIAGSQTTRRAQTPAPNQQSNQQTGQLAGQTSNQQPAQIPTQGTPQIPPTGFGPLGGSASNALPSGTSAALTIGTGLANGTITVPPSSTNSSQQTPPTSKPAMARVNESRLEMGVPKVRLYVSGPPSVQVGKSLPYEVILRNEGTEVLSGVIVSMTVPATVKSSSLVATAGEYETEKDPTGAETILWHVTELQPSQSRIFRVGLEATRPEPFDMNLEWTLVPQTGQFKVDVQQPQLHLGIEGPTDTIYGKSEIYRMRIRNPGNAIAKDVEVKLTAEPYGSNQSKIGDIPAGGERLVEVELTFQKAGAISIVGEAISAISSVEAKSQIDVSVKQVELAAQWNTPPAQYLGSVMDYSLVVKNNSNIPAQNVVCVLTLPPSLKVSSTPPGCTVTKNEVRWTVPQLAAQTSNEQVFSLSATDIGTAPISCTVQSESGGATVAETTVSIESVTDLKLTVVDPVAPAPVGQDVVYDLVIANRGTRPATAVKLLAQFSSGIEPVRVEGATGQMMPGQVIFDPISVIGPGDQITLRVFAQATTAGVHRFRAELECEEGETQLIEEESTRYLATSRTDVNKSIRR